jgi:hypothetical protein
LGSRRRILVDLQANVVKDPLRAVIRQSWPLKKLFLRLMGLALLAFAVRFVWGIRQLF